MRMDMTPKQFARWVLDMIPLALILLIVVAATKLYDWLAPAVADH